MFREFNLRRLGIFILEHLDIALKPNRDNNPPLVSVIMPVLNSERYLAEAIQSVLDQSFADFELVIISEYGNSEESERIIASFSDSRISVIKNVEKLGFVKSLNHAILQAQGKYVARIDADDLYLPRALEYLASHLEEHDDIFLCYARQQTPFGLGSPFLGSHDKIKATLLFLWYINHPMMWRRREFIDHGLFFNENAAMEDFALFSELVHTFKFAQINEYLYIYRITDDSITNKKLDKLCLNTREIISKNIARLGVQIPYQDLYLFQLWRRPLCGHTLRERRNAKYLLKNYLFDILAANKQLCQYDNTFLFEACDEKYLAATDERLFGFNDILNPRKGFSNIYPDKLRACFNLCLWRTKRFFRSIIKVLLRPPFRLFKAWALKQQTPAAIAATTPLADYTAAQKSALFLTLLIRRIRRL